MQHARFYHVVQIADIGGQYHVGRAVVAFRLQPLKQSLFGVDNIHLSAGLVAEAAQDRFDQLRLSERVEVDFAIGPSWRGRRDQRQEKHGYEARAEVRAHETSPINKIEIDYQSHVTGMRCGMQCANPGSGAVFTKGSVFKGYALG